MANLSDIQGVKRDRQYSKYLLFLSRKAVEHPGKRKHEYVFYCIFYNAIALAVKLICQQKTAFYYIVIVCFNIFRSECSQCIHCTVRIGFAIKYEVMGYFRNCIFQVHWKFYLVDHY